MLLVLDKSASMSFSKKVCQKIIKNCHLNFHTQTGFSCDSNGMETFLAILRFVIVGIYDKSLIFMGANNTLTIT